MLNFQLKWGFRLKTIVLLPVEIYSREFFSRTLLASILARNGYVAYVGAKAEIDNLIIKGAISHAWYIAKGGVDHKFINRLRRQKIKLAVLDEEMGPAVRDVNLSYRGASGRFYPGTSNYISKVFLYSEAHLRAIQTERPKYAKLCSVVGWPRVDLWENMTLFPIFNRKAKEIEHKHGKFLLFSSDFGVISERSLEYHIETSDYYNADERAKYVQLWREEFRQFKRFCNSINNSNVKNISIIIRPHPSEDIRDWHREIKSRQNVKIISEGTVSEWILASQAVMHRGCTSGIEATFQGKDSYFLSSFSSGHFKSKDDRSLPIHYENFDEIIENLSKREDLLSMQEVDSCQPMRYFKSAERISNELSFCESNYNYSFLFDIWRTLKLISRVSMLKAPLFNRFLSSGKLGKLAKFEKKGVFQISQERVKAISMPIGNHFQKTLCVSRQGPLLYRIQLDEK